MKKFTWKKIGALALATCTCLTTLHFSVPAVANAAYDDWDDEDWEDDDFGQSPSDGEEHIILSDSDLMLPLDGDSYSLIAYYDKDYEDWDDEDWEDDEDWDDEDWDDEDDDPFGDYDYYDGDLSWSSSNPNVAEVDQDGEVTPRKAGEATITATTDSGTEATCEVTVCYVKLNKTELNLTAGKTSTELKIQRQFPSWDDVNDWDSSNESVATVNEDGKIKAKKAGTTTITVTMDSGAEASCKVRVKAPATKKISFTKKSMTMAKGQKVTLTVKRDPIGATDKISWSSSDPKVLQVTSKGVAKAKKTGTVTITAKTANGKKATCKITVKDASITLKKNSATLKVKKSVKIQVKSTVPAKDTIKSYKTNRPKVATVDNKGKVTAKGKGTATITVTTKSGAKAYFNVTVK